MGLKADLLNQYRKEVKAGSYVGTFNEYTEGRFTDKGGAAEARRISRALADASKDMDAQIRAVGGDPFRMSLEEKKILFANFGAAKRAGTARFYQPQTTTVTAGESADDVANRAGMTMDDLRLQNPSTFGMTGPNSITGGVDAAVFAGQQLNVSGLPSVQGPQPLPSAASVTGAGVAQPRTQGMTLLPGAVGAPTSAAIGGRGTAVPTAADYAARAQGLPSQPTLPQDFSGLARVPTTAGVSLGAPGAQATLKTATRDYTNKNGRLTQAQIDGIYASVDSSTTGTMEEIMSRNADNPDFQMEAMLDAFASPSFVATLDALHSGVPPTYIDQKAFNALTEGPRGLGMLDKETSDFMKKYYERRPLQGNAWFYVGSQDPADTTAGGGGGPNTVIDTQGIKRSINRLLQSAVGGGSGGPRGTGSTGSGFTPTRRAIMWRI